MAGLLARFHLRAYRPIAAALPTILSMASCKGKGPTRNVGANAEMIEPARATTTALAQVAVSGVCVTLAVGTEC